MSRPPSWPCRRWPPTCSRARTSCCCSTPSPDWRAPTTPPPGTAGARCRGASTPTRCRRRGRSSARRGSTGNGGRTMSGGLDSNAMQSPRQIFGAARKIENGGSLTIIGTALVDTGSRMDQIIFEEFKGTGNSEIFLSRELAERRIYPAIDIPKSGTRKEEKLIPPNQLSTFQALRRILVQMPPQEAMLKLVDRLGRTKTNEDFFNLVRVGDS